MQCRIIIPLTKGITIPYIKSTNPGYFCGSCDVHFLEKNMTMLPRTQGNTTNGFFFIAHVPKASMHGIFTYIYHKNQPNVGKYTTHGWYGVVLPRKTLQ